MASTSDSSRINNLVDLQGLIQSIASQRRSGELTVATDIDKRRIRFTGGQISAVSGMRPDFLSRALCWATVITREKMHPVLSGLPAGSGPQDLLHELLDQNLIDVNGALDAVDVLIEEEFTNILTWQNPTLNFQNQLSVDPWADAQVSLGVAINAGATLLEALRRQDEMSSVSQHIPNAWDTLLRVPEAAVPEALGPDPRSFLQDWRDGIPCGAYLESYRMATFRATMAVVGLRVAGLIRISTAPELVMQADAANQAGNNRKAFGLYRRALALGHDTPRIHLQIAELAERFGDKVLAAESCLAAAGQLADPVAASAVLHNALRLGADKEGPLSQLVALHVSMGQNEPAVQALLELARLYERRKAFDQSVQALREAQGLGADSATTGLMLARLFIALGDADQATLQLELAARALLETDRLAEAVTAWRELVRLQPGRCDYARECAEVYLWTGDKPAAVDVLRTALNAQRRKNLPASDELLLTMYELLAKLDPSEVMAHDWLAKAYERRRDRDGATAQLRLAAAAQEKSGADGDLANTLERILELDPHQVDVLDWVAKVRLRLKQDGLAAVLWAKAADAALAQGLRKEARAMLESAISRLPGSYPLRSRLALVANRENDRVEATRQYLAAADLARGASDLEAARDLLVQASRMRPDDLLLRVRLAEVAEELKDPNLERIEAEVVRVAVRSSNNGIALEHARKRIAIAPTFEARSELVELLRRVGDHPGELLAGQELLVEILADAKYDQAIELLSRLVASHPKNADLVLQLATSHNHLADSRQALRCFRHAVVLLQMDDRLQDTRGVLDQIQKLSEESDVVEVARERLEQGVPVDWEKIRLELSQGARRKAVERLTEIGTNGQRRPPTDRSIKTPTDRAPKAPTDPVTHPSTDLELL